MARRVLIHCNAGVEYGMGHAMRSAGLAEAALDDGWDVVIGGDLSSAARNTLRVMLPSARVEVSESGDSANWLQEAAGRLDPDVVHVDSYWLGEATIPDQVPLVSNMQDGSFGVRIANLTIDGNHGAESWLVRPTQMTACIVGAPGAVIRQQVLRQRHRPHARGPIPRVLVVIGGTDAARLTLRCLDALIAVTAPLDITVICRRDQMNEARRLAITSPHRVDVRGFVEDLPALARQHDLIVSAAGTSVWDFACMGIPMALVCAAQNQRAGYDAMVKSGLVLGLGDAPYSDLGDRMRAIEDLLADAPVLEDHRDRLMALVDGRGAWRIVASWSQLREIPLAFGPDLQLRARAATREDAQMLFDWRDDPQTRIASRSSDRLDWDGHVRWVEASLADPRRQLLIVEDDGARPVGTVRWDRRGADWEVSITVNPAAREQHFGSAILDAGERAIADPRPGRLLATIHRDNAASRRLFARAGYLPHLPSDADGFAVSAKWRFAT